MSGRDLGEIRTGRPPPLDEQENAAGQAGRAASVWTLEAVLRHRTEAVTRLDDEAVSGQRIDDERYPVVSGR